MLQVERYDPDQKSPVQAVPVAHQGDRQHHILFNERNTKLIKHLAEKSFSVLRDVDALPPSTLKLFPVNCFVIFTH